MVKKSGEGMKVEKDKFLIDGRKSAMMTMRRWPLADHSNRKDTAANSRQFDGWHDQATRWRQRT